MIKTDLPVLILRQIILLPNNELRIEFDIYKILNEFGTKM